MINKDEPVMFIHELKSYVYVPIHLRKIHNSDWCPPHMTQMQLKKLER